MLQTLDTLALLAHRPQKLFECNTLLAMLELLQHEPIHVRWPPRLLARIMPPEPKHERGDLLALALEVFARCLTGAREITHRLMPLIGHPDPLTTPASGSCNIISLFHLTGAYTLVGGPNPTPADIGAIMGMRRLLGRTVAT